MEALRPRWQARCSCEFFCAAPSSAAAIARGHAYASHAVASTSSDTHHLHAAPPFAGPLTA